MLVLVLVLMLVGRRVARARATGLGVPFPVVAYVAIVDGVVAPVRVDEGGGGGEASEEALLRPRVCVLVVSHREKLLLSVRAFAGA